MEAVFLRTFGVILLAEMGDKSQLLLAALAADCRRRDLLVGALGAIALLCGLAVSVGAVIGEHLPLTVLSLTAGLAFLFFARSGLREEGDQPAKRGRVGALSVFGTYFLAELGDKTQLATLTFAAGSPTERWAVFFGASAALALSGFLGAAVGVLLGKRLPPETFRAISFLLFTACGAVKLLEGLERLLPIPVAIGGTVALLAAFLLTCFLHRTRNLSLRSTEHE